MSLVRQDEANRVIDTMNESPLSSLLPRSKKTWQDKDYETTIDLMLATEELSNNLVQYGIYGTDHGLDHQTINTTLNIDVHNIEPNPRLHFMDTPWKEVNARISKALKNACMAWKYNKTRITNGNRTGGCSQTDHCQGHSRTEEEDLLGCVSCRQ